MAVAPMDTLNYQTREAARAEGFRRVRGSLLGPTWEDVWQSLAGQLGGRFVASRMGMPAHVVVTVGRWPVMLDLRPALPGRSDLGFAHLRTPYRTRDGFRFASRRAGLASTVAGLLGFGGVAVGDRAFDDLFDVRGTDAGRVRALFADPAVRALVGGHPDARVEARYDRRGAGPPRAGDLCWLAVTAHGSRPEAHRVRPLFALSAAVLDRLADLGSADPPRPGDAVPG